MTAYAVKQKENANCRSSGCLDLFLQFKRIAMIGMCMCLLAVAASLSVETSLFAACRVFSHDAFLTCRYVAIRGNGVSLT